MNTATLKFVVVLVLTVWTGVEIVFIKNILVPIFNEAKKLVVHFAGAERTHEVLPTEIVDDAVVDGLDVVGGGLVLDEVQRHDLGLRVALHRQQLDDLVVQF